MTPAAKLHAWLVAQWQAKLHTARAANERVDAMFWVGVSGDHGRHIAAFNPTFAIAVCEAALSRLERHRPFVHTKADSWYSCGTCQQGMALTRWPCTEVLDYAAPFADRPDFPEELKHP